MTHAIEHIPQMIHHSLALDGEKSASMIRAAEKHIMMYSIIATVFLGGRIVLEL